MEFSIINILDDHFDAKEGVAVKIIVQKNGREEIIFNGNSDFIGQTFFSHHHTGWVFIFLNNKLHCRMNIPTVTTIYLT